MPDPPASPPGSPTPGGGDGARDPERSADEPWIETREGGFFFVNALLIFPYVMLLVPLLTRVFVRGVLGGLPRESTIVDTFPMMAEHLLPRTGWLVVLPAGLVVWNLRIETRPLPRATLWLFLAVHLAFLAWTVTGWIGIHGWTLPGGPG
jgi:hypothetical protein